MCLTLGVTQDNFKITPKQSLCKNLERADTKRWLTETLETLMKERSGEEKKEEGKKLEVRSKRMFSNSEVNN